MKPSSLPCAIKRLGYALIGLTPIIRILKKIYFEGAGTLGGAEICLSSELNTLIGIRGSGKSSVLEGVRYALNIPLGDQAADVEYKEGLVKHLLRSGGRITLDAVDRRGQEYQIRRILGERPDVYVDSVLQPGVSIRETVLHQPVYFGQKDLSSTSTGFEKDLIEKLAGEVLIPVRRKIEQGQLHVTDAIRQIQRLARTSTQKDEWLHKKQDAEFKLEFYQHHGVEARLQMQIEFDRDERKVRQVIQGAQEFLSELNVLLSRFEDELKNRTLHQSTQNQSFFEKFFAIYQKLLEGFDTIKQFATDGQDSVQQLQGRLNEFQQHKQDLKEDFAEIERKLANELKQAGAQAISPQEFRQLKTLLDQSELMLQVSAKIENQSVTLNQSLERELDQLNDLWLEEYRIIEQKLDKINQVDSPLKIVPQFKADKTAMLRWIQKLFRGSRIHGTTLQSAVKQFSDFGAMWRGKDEMQSILGSSFEMFWKNFEENLDTLLTWQVPNVYTIEYHGKALTNHSLGQRASALILFILSQRENDVVIID